MLKYVDTDVTFQEVPGETTLCINISNCPCHCEGCHSSHLAEDIGEPLSIMELQSMILLNRGITCVAFMGGDSEPGWVDFLAEWVKKGSEIKVACIVVGKNCLIKSTLNTLISLNSGLIAKM